MFRKLKKNSVACFSMSISILCDTQYSGLNLIVSLDCFKNHELLSSIRALNVFYFFCFLCLKVWNYIITNWAPPSEFVSSSIPSWQILTAHAQPFRGARDLASCLKVPLDSLLVWASSGGSGETARMRRLAWTFAARIGYKYQIRLMRSNWSCSWFYRIIKKVPCFCNKLWKFLIHWTIISKP